MYLDTFVCSKYVYIFIYIKKWIIAKKKWSTMLHVFDSTSVLPRVFLRVLFALATA